MNVRRYNIGNQVLHSIVEVTRDIYSKMSDKMKRRTNSKKDIALADRDYDYVTVPTEERNDDKKTAPRRGLQGDYGNIMLLMFLYILQGIPLGLGGSIPMLLQSRKVSYKEQALFSFIYWPFSIKLLWAPLVDSLYVKWFGRRKSWMVPTQYLIGIFMLVLSAHIDDLLGTETDEPGKVDIKTLTAVFFCLNFLAATQDIAVDGWALTMLSRYMILYLFF
jgi:PAT family acetyl-CoA transporter-like MFS transporter 1